MRRHDGTAVLTGVGLTLTFAVACATSQPPPESEPSDSGECAFEVRNETNVALSVTAGGVDVRQLGSLEPGRSLRFHESCDIDEVLITATSTQSGEPAIGPGPGRTRDRVIQRRVGPWPGHVVRVRLRFPEQITPGADRIDRCPAPVPGLGGSDSPVPPRTDERDAPAVAPELPPAF